LWDGSVYQFLLEVYFPFKSHLPPYFRLGEAIIGDLLYIVNHAVQEPLDIYFDFFSEGKPVQALVSSDVGKDRFGHREALRVNLAPQFTVNLAGHPPGKVGEFNPNRYPQIFSFASFVSDATQLQGATPTILFLSHIYPVHQTISASFFRYPSESFALRAPVVVGGLLVMKIL
jgi:hypothetical protein